MEVTKHLTEVVQELNGHNEVHANIATIPILYNEGEEIVHTPEIIPQWKKSNHAYTHIARLLRWNETPTPIAATLQK